MQLKELICSMLKEQLGAKIATANRAITSAKEARDNETKSSAGDKYETGRELMQFEVDKQSAQLHQLQRLKSDLAKVHLKKKHTKIAFGSVVCTNQGDYFLSVSLGKVKVVDKTYYALSLASPLGKMLLGKSAGDNFVFQAKEFVIQELF